MDELAVAPPSVQVSIKDIEKFFEPALRDRDDNGFIADRLLTAEPDAHGTSRVDLLKRATLLLASLHSALRYDQTLEDSVYDSSLLLAAYKLLDFLSLEGIYPSLPAGAGALQDRRSKALFYKNADPNYASPAGEDALGLVLEVLDSAVEKVDLGIEPLVRQRVLVDIIAAKAWVAHQNGTQNFQPPFLTYLRKLPLSTLFQTYTALLKSHQPGWLRSMISGQLSELSLRPNGVRATIDFIAASYQGSQSQGNGEESNTSGGPSIPLDAMQHASKLLSSVPSSMTADQYFTKIAPQLLELLDNSQESALQRAAAHVIGRGILGKRSTGAPSSVGWKLFAEPLLLTIQPSGSSPNPGDADRKGTLVSEQDLRLALQRLSTLLLSQPNPGLTGRLLKPLLYPLWAISNFTASSFAATETSKAANALLKRFFELVGNVQDLYILVDGIVWDGQRTWRYGQGQAGSIAIVGRQMIGLGFSESFFDDQISVVARRAQAFCRFVKEAHVSDQDIAAVLCRLCREQLGGIKPGGGILRVDEDPYLKLAKTQLLQTMVETFADDVSKIAVEMLEVVSAVLQNYLDHQAPATGLSQGTAKPTLSALLSIVQPAKDPAEQDFETDELPMTTALSLLTTILTSASEIHSAAAQAKLTTLQKQLRAVSASMEAENPLNHQIQAALTLLASIHKTAATAQRPAAQHAPDTDSEALQLILSDLSSPLPPLRRSALHALNSLIKSPATTVDVPALTVRLLELLRTEPEEYVYLAAIQTSLSLALHGNLLFVSGVFADAFQDLAERTGVDGRLRMGEALFSLAGEMEERSGDAVRRGEAVRGVARTLVEVAGRRGRREREVGQRERERRLLVGRRREAERAWGGDVPDLEELRGAGDEDAGELARAGRERRSRELEEIEQIVGGWEETGFAEDVRIRASAMSILGRLVETCGPDLTAGMLEGVTELALAILTLELGGSAAILRRAATLAVYGLLRSLDAALEAERALPATGFVGDGQWSKIEKVMGWVRDTEDDALTKGHAEAVLEGLEAVRMKVIQRAGQEDGKGLEGRLRGLDVKPGDRDTSQDQRQIGEKRQVVEELE